MIPPPPFCGACLNPSREKDPPFLSLVDREVEFCVIVLHLLGNFYCEEKSQFM